MIRGIHHVALHTPNLEKMLRFYCDVIGFTVIQRVEWANDPLIDEVIGMPGSAAKQAMLRAANVHLELFEYSSPTPRDAGPARPCDHGYTHICLDVTNIDEEFDRLAKAGVVFARRRPGDFGDIKAVYGRDPDGNVIELQETTSDHETAMAQLGSIRFT